LFSTAPAEFGERRRVLVAPIITGARPDCDAATA